MYIFSSGSKSSSSSNLLGNSFHFFKIRQFKAKETIIIHEEGLILAKVKKTQHKHPGESSTTTDDEEENANRIKLKTKAKII